MPFKTIVTGATGMVGEGVMLECLLHPDVSEVLIVNRRPSGFSHPKLKEIVHKDFFDLSPIAHELTGYDACFFCLGVTSIGKNEEEYTKYTHTLTMHFAETVAARNPDMTFCYVSGSGTDSTEKGRVMWARVKGRTENDLAKMFKKFYAFRPGFMKPTPGQKNALSFYKYVNWMFPILRNLMPKLACTLKEVGIAMIHTVTKGYEKKTLEVTDIVELAKR
ncbi:NAD-dependent epimerase/dehydratase family protein [Polluticoccus soli]|uniref:NAD-dependent epimerase/dehydratase family protein n=1 Tax=Polluticoccus soli TaxID=3034150 RepID=UPI0023E315AE|nr:NAD-dependent epimerase/dehydratase family protein [Flavipsychrobacter sp. JY13-12]